MDVDDAAAAAAAAVEEEPAEYASFTALVPLALNFGLPCRVSKMRGCSAAAAAAEAAPGTGSGRGWKRIAG
jgi:hypothetical protein